MSGAGPLLLALGAALAALLPGPAGAHHVGVYVPRDNPISANFKQIKFAVQAGKFDAAARLFESGAVRAEMRAQSARLPADLEEATRASIQSGDARGAERCLMILFATLARDLAAEADRRLADPAEPAGARLAAGQKFLEAIWRYYNLVDFAVTQYDSKAGVTIRLALDEAESATGPAPAGPDPARMREPLRRIARTLSAVIETSSTTPRRS